MICLPTVVLEHRLPGGWHFDWLLADPADPQGPLWTARLDRPPADWMPGGQLMLEHLPPHRRTYLTYEGPVSGNRGTVRRVAQGDHYPSLWTPGRCLTTVVWEGLPGTFEVAMTKLPGSTNDRWLAALTARTTPAGR